MAGIAKETVRDQNGKEIEVTRSSGNVFADLELANPEELLRKSTFVFVISQVVTQRKLTQVKAAEIMGVSQPDLSKLLRGRTTSFSLDKLMSMLVALGVTTNISFELPEKFGRPGKVVIDHVARKETEKRALPKVAESRRATYS